MAPKQVSPVRAGAHEQCPYCGARLGFDGGDAACRATSPGRPRCSASYPGGGERAGAVRLEASPRHAPYRACCAELIGVVVLTVMGGAARTERTRRREPHVREAPLTSRASGPLTFRSSGGLVTGRKRRGSGPGPRRGGAGSSGARVAALETPGTRIGRPTRPPAKSGRNRAKAGLKRRRTRTNRPWGRTPKTLRNPVLSRPARARLGGRGGGGDRVNRVSGIRSYPARSAWPSRRSAQRPVALTLGEGWELDELLAELA
jgi:hypothetical protein